MHYVTILIIIDLLTIPILRDFQAIIAEVLDCAQLSQGITKTRVMYKVQLSYTQSKEYLQCLHDSELISYDEQDKVFRTTTKGKKFLKIYGEISKLPSGHKDVNFRSK